MPARRLSTPPEHPCQHGRFNSLSTRQIRGRIMSTLPAQMTAIGIPKPGGPDALVPEQRPVPKPGAGEILIKVAAAGVNRPDVAQRTGNYPPPPGASDI